MMEHLPARRTPTRCACLARDGGRGGTFTSASSRTATATCPTGHDDLHYRDGVQPRRRARHPASDLPDGRSSIPISHRDVETGEGAAKLKRLKARLKKETRRQLLQIARQTCAPTSSTACRSSASHDLTDIPLRQRHPRAARTLRRAPLHAPPIARPRRAQRRVERTHRLGRRTPLASLRRAHFQRRRHRRHGQERARRGNGSTTSPRKR